MKSALVITKQDEVFKSLRQNLGQNWHLEKASVETLNINKSLSQFGIIFLDLEIFKQGKNIASSKIGEEVKHIKEKIGNIPLVAMVSSERLSEATKALKNGANLYITYPIEPTKFKHLIDSLKVITEEGISKSPGEHFWKVTVSHLVRTESPLMRKVFDDIKRVAPTDATVLLTGETGTGKNMLAKLIHEHSHRADKPFIPVHCGAIPEGLIESEFFGHEKGAFTGAVRRKLGKFEIANGGTIFLDEIGTITLPVQIKLLQVLQEGIFYRVGGDNPLQTDVRVIAAANVNLKALVDQGCFRQDLFYRLNVFPIFVPPLRERKEDIPLLVEIILEKLNRRHHRNIRAVAPEVMEAFTRYNWPGNIRELENVMERAYIIESNDILTPSNFPSEIIVSAKKCHEHFMDAFSLLSSEKGTFPNISEFRRIIVDHAERIYLTKLLRANNGHINASAKSAGITTRQLRKLMVKHGLRREQFKKGPMC
ncbi:MAG: sigma-54 dependent transcriptional regulator [Syntrophobacterales bacterium]|nr:sigma-54 dependent transcriptional regulator [Syntrophobacterales bacterium]